MVKGDLISINRFRGKSLVGQFEHVMQNGQDICVFSYDHNKYVFLPIKNISMIEVLGKDTTDDKTGRVLPKTTAPKYQETKDGKKNCGNCRNGGGKIGLDPEHPKTACSYCFNLIRQGILCI